MCYASGTKFLRPVYMIRKKKKKKLRNKNEMWNTIKVTCFKLKFGMLYFLVKIDNIYRQVEPNSEAL